MTTRRQVLATVGTGVVGGLAGCSECGETWTGYRLALSLDEVAASSEEWSVTVTAAVEIEFPKGDEAVGLDRLEVAAYGPSLEVLARTTVTDLQWGSVPESGRSEGDCGSGGTATATRTLTTATVPSFVGPRFPDAADAAAFDPGSYSDLYAITALRHGRIDAAVPSGASGNASSGNESDWNASTGNASSGTGWPPNAVSATDYESVRVAALPWPEPDDQAVTATEAFESVRFDTEVGCVGERGDARATTESFDSDVRLHWSRPIPAGSCERPYLEAASYDDGVATMQVGLAPSPSVRCRDCRYVRYSADARLRESVTGPVTSVVVEHVGAEGAVGERAVLQLE